MEKYPVGGGMNVSMVGENWDVQGSYDEWKKPFEKRGWLQGGVWMGDGERRATIATSAESPADGVVQLLRLYVGVRSQVPIAGAVARVYRWFVSVLVLGKGEEDGTNGCIVGFEQLCAGFMDVHALRVLHPHRVSGLLRPLPGI
jgi:hypothetical protein